MVQDRSLLSIKAQHVHSMALRCHIRLLQAQGIGSDLLDVPCQDASETMRKMLRDMRQDVRNMTEVALEDCMKMGATAPEKPMNTGSLTDDQVKDAISEMVGTATSEVVASMKRVDKEMELVERNRAKRELNEKSKISEEMSKHNELVSKFQQQEMAKGGARTLAYQHEVTKWKVKKADNLTKASLASLHKAEVALDSVAGATHLSKPAAKLAIALMSAEQEMFKAKAQVSISHEYCTQARARAVAAKANMVTHAAVFANLDHKAQVLTDRATTTAATAQAAMEDALEKARAVEEGTGDHELAVDAQQQALDLQRTANLAAEVASDANIEARALQKETDGDQLESDKMEKTSTDMCALITPTEIHAAEMSEQHRITKQTFEIAKQRGKKQLEMEAAVALSALHAADNVTSPTTSLGETGHLNEEVDKQHHSSQTALARKSHEVGTLGESPEVTKLRSEVETRKAAAAEATAMAGALKNRLEIGGLLLESGCHGQVLICCI